MNEERATMTEAEFAKAVGVSRTTLWRLRRKGLVPHYKVGGRILYSKKHIEQFLQAQERYASHNSD